MRDFRLEAGTNGEECYNGGSGWSGGGGVLTTHHDKNMEIFVCIFLCFRL